MVTCPRFTPIHFSIGMNRLNQPSWLQKREISHYLAVSFFLVIASYFSVPPSIAMNGMWMVSTYLHGNHILVPECVGELNSGGCPHLTLETNGDKTVKRRT